MRRDSSALRVSRLPLVGLAVVGVLAALPAVPWLGRCWGFVTGWRRRRLVLCRGDGHEWYDGWWDWYGSCGIEGWALGGVYCAVGAVAGVCAGSVW